MATEKIKRVPALHATAAQPGFDEGGDRFTIDEYDLKKPFASFLPGIAGVDGRPLWCFYTNRGQAVASFGVDTKEAPILEFRPADQAYRDVPRLGFRTFLRSGGTVTEPFGLRADRTAVGRTMSVGPADVVLRETGGGVDVAVQFAGLPHEPFPALLRQVMLTNTRSEALTVEVADGLPRLVPFGIGEWALKHMSNTAAAWIETNVDDPLVPGYRIRASMEDTVTVRAVEGSHFMVAAATDGSAEVLLAPVVDAAAIFGQDTAFGHPTVVANEGLAGVLDRRMALLGRYPAAFVAYSVRLEPGASCVHHMVIGATDSLSGIRSRRSTVGSRAWFAQRMAESREVVAEVTRWASMKSAAPALDAYTRQTALDNVLRGGYALVYGEGFSPPVYHVYSRKHGDTERDYNAFSLPPRGYSAGFGNFRDINQNRRTDVLAFPQAGRSILTPFVDLIQLDGYNPLVVHPPSFSLTESDHESLLSKHPALTRLNAAEFRPDDVAGLLSSDPEAVNEVLARAQMHTKAEFHEGYWVDHWTYTLDLIEQVLRIYPDREHELFLDPAQYRWYDGPKTVRPLTRRFRASAAGVEPLDHLADRSPGSSPLDHESSLLEKLVLLAVVKLATLGRTDTGIEMEAGRPGWYDALNGMPAQFGASLPDAAELVRLIRLIVEIAERYDDAEAELPDPLWSLRDRLAQISSIPDGHERWLARWAARDGYRAALDDPELSWSSRPLSEAAGWLGAEGERLEQRLREAASDNGGLLPTYYAFEPDKWRTADDGFVVPGDLRRRTLPLFLEGVVKQLRLADSDGAKDLYDLVRSSDLYDTGLGMYRVNAPLSSEPPTIGRARAFPDGWLENGSIWLHMEYKYLLEVLRAGLARQFWDDASHCLVPFLDPEVYGRSTFENSSFLASSLYAESAEWGRGFVARLSGATAEYLTMWTEFLLGPRPFTMESGELGFSPRPALPGSLFTKEGELVWSLFGHTEVVYRNPSRRDIYPAVDGPDASNVPARIAIVRNDSDREQAYEASLPGDAARALRSRLIQRMVVDFT